MSERPRLSRLALLSKPLALAAVCTAVAMGAVCAVAVSSLSEAAAGARLSVGRQLALIDDSLGMRAFWYQKGFVNQYVLTGDRKWLVDPQTAQPSFEAWLARANAAAE